MSDFPWLATPEEIPQTVTLTESVSGCSITLPKIGGLLLDEMLFSQWLNKQDYPFLKADFEYTPDNMLGLTDFCHKFLCLRLGYASWGGDDLVFDGEVIKPAQSLAVKLPSGQTKMAPMFLLYLIWAFYFEEVETWQRGKSESNMVSQIQNLISLKSQTGRQSTGDSNQSIQEDSAEESLEDAPLPQSKAPSKRRKSAGSNGLKTKAA